MPVTRDQFLAARKLKTVAVHLEQIGEVLVREPTAGEWDEFDHAAEGKALRLVCQFTVDETGKRLFTDADMGRLAMLGASRIEPVALHILDLAGVTERAMQAAAKNSSTTQMDDSASD